jgi:hypothetical protein
MKRVSIFLGSIFILLTSFGVYMNTHYPPTKTYTVTLTQSEWANRLKFIADAKEIMRKSSYPGTVISQVTDSLESFSLEINQQVGNQIQKERTDTTKPKNK